MSSPLTDPKIIRAFILHDALLKIPVFQGYQNMRNIVGNDVISYADYDFWYHRFYRGNLDFKYDRSADPTPPMLEELPMEVLDAILGNLDFKNRFKVRQLSKTMLQVVDQLKTVHTHLAIRCFENSLRLTIGGVAWSLQYTGWTKGRCKIEKDHNRSKIIKGDFWEIALHDLSILLKSPKLHIVQFGVEDKDSGAFQKVLDTVGEARNSKKIHVDHAEIIVKDSPDAMALLAMLKPGALESLIIEISNEIEPNMGSLKDMEQFRQLKSVDLTQFGVISTFDLPHFYGFEFFYITVKTMSPADVLSLRENLSKLDNKTKLCIIAIQTAANLVEIGKALGEEVEEGNRHVKHTCSIDNSKIVLKFQIKEDQVRVSKVDTTEPVFHAYDYDSDDSDDDVYLSDDYDSVSSDDDDYNDDFDE